MRRAAAIHIGCLALALALCASAPAAPLAGFDVRIGAEGGVPGELRAGSHPHSIVYDLDFAPGSAVRDVSLALPPGLIENPAATNQCPRARFNTPRVSPFEASRSGESCPGASQVGVVEVRTAGGAARSFGLFNLVPPPGRPSQLGASPYGAPLVFTPRLRQAGGDYGLTLELENATQRIAIQGLTLTVWGSPWSLVHDTRRGRCLNEAEPTFGWAKCPIPENPDHEPWAYLTLPASCGPPLAFSARVSSWSGGQESATAPSRDAQGDPAGLRECEALDFEPLVSAQPTNYRASSPTGFAFSLTPKEDALTDPERLVPSQPKSAVVALPEGITVNPSVAAGLGSCDEADYAAEGIFTAPGAGCPNDSKIGSFTVGSPLFSETVEGSVYLATPGENPFEEMLAVYLVARSAERGVLVKVAGSLEADPDSGRLTAHFDGLPQLPYRDLELRFREGQRAPLLAPAECGDYEVRVELSPWNGAGEEVASTSRFGIDSGLGPGGSCPRGAPPFDPTAVGGTLNSNSGSASPFYLRLARRDTEQELTSYSATLPEGLTGKLAGVATCPEAAIAAARGRSGVAEREDPSCPAGSRIGRTLTGYGVADVLAYAPGRMFLAGPFAGRPLSVVTVNSAAVGPFDLGTVVIRSAFSVDPRTGRLAIDSRASEPIPHILEGIPTHVRDIRVYIDRPGFTINPTRCDPSEVVSTLGGSGELLGDPSDDGVATVANRFQVFDCLARGFAPRLGLRLIGARRRGGYPALRAVYAPRAGDANLRRIAVALPHTAFLAQNHIRAICTRPRFEASSCPRGAIYGRAAAFTPLLDAPLRGPVYLRASDNPLPDLVADLRAGAIRIVAQGRIDSVGAGRIRATFAGLPDAPLDRFVLAMRGGRRGLLTNSAHLCRVRPRAAVRAVAQNNRGRLLRPLLRTGCRQKSKRKRSKRRRGASNGQRNRDRGGGR